MPRPTVIDARPPRPSRPRRLKWYVWVVLGSVIALALGAAAAGPLHRLTEQVALPAATLSLEPAQAEETRTPTPTPLTPSLTWESRTSIDGSCVQLRILWEDGVHYGPCSEAPLYAELSGDEDAGFAAYVLRYRAFEYAAAGAGDAPAGRTIKLSFVGTGSRDATGPEMADVAGYAAAVYSRMAEDDRRARMVARSRAHLAAHLGMSTDAIEDVSADRVVWPDGCLGVPSPGLACAEVETQGYLVLLRADGRIYEYHTDVRLLVRMMPTAAPATPAPTDPPPATTTPWPTPTQRPLVITDWLGEYWANSSLAGAPNLVRNDRSVGFDWGNGSPSWSIPSDYFSARWRQRVSFGTGDYRFRIQADDGVRLWVAGKLLVDRWHGGLTDDWVTQHIWSGEHEVVVEYFEQAGVASVRIDWQKATKTATPTPEVEPAYAEWKAEYYNNQTLRGDPQLVRNETALAFDWKSGSPHGTIRRDRFSARFLRRLKLPAGVYNVSIVGDDGYRLFIDDVLAIDSWHSGHRRRAETDVTLSGGSHVFRVEYFEVTGGAALFFGLEVKVLAATETPEPTATPIPSPTSTRTSTLTRTPTRARTPTLPAAPLGTRVSPIGRVTSTYTPLPSATPSRTATRTRTATRSPSSTSTTQPAPAQTATKTPVWSSPIGRLTPTHTPTLDPTSTSRAAGHPGSLPTRSATTQASELPPGPHKGAPVLTNTPPHWVPVARPTQSRPAHGATGEPLVPSKGMPVTATVATPPSASKGAPAFTDTPALWVPAERPTATGTLPAVGSEDDAPPVASIGDPALTATPKGGPAYPAPSGGSLPETRVTRMSPLKPIPEDSNPALATPTMKPRKVLTPTRTLTLLTVSDTYLDANRPLASYGRSDVLRLSRSRGEGAKNALLRFPALDLPESSVVISATLSVQVVHVSAERPLALAIAPASRAWNERISFNMAMGVVRLSPAELQVEAVASGLGAQHWDVTAIVRAWVDGSVPNHGLVLDTTGTSSRAGVSYEIASREHKGAGQIPPSLEVSYYVPKPIANQPAGGGTGAGGRAGSVPWPWYQ